MSRSAQTKTRTKKRVAPSHQSFKLQKRIKSPAPSVESGFIIARDAWRLIWSYRATFLIQILVIYFLYALLVRGFGEVVGIQDIKASLESGAFGLDSGLAQSFSLLGTLLSGATSSQNNGASIIQLFIFIITSLSTIWLLRGAEAKEEGLSVKESYYSGTVQFVPFTLVLMYISLLLMPLVFANSALIFANVNGLLVTNPERTFAFVLVGLINLFSLFLAISASIALLVVSLPDARPVASIKTANKIVEHRRILIFSRLIALLVVLSVAISAIMIPILNVNPVLAEYVFFFLFTLVIVYIHAFMYKLYRALIK